MFLLRLFWCYLGEPSGWGSVFLWQRRGGANCLDYVKEGAQLHYDDYVLPNNEFYCMIVKTIIADALNHLTLLTRTRTKNLRCSSRIETKRSSRNLSNGSLE